MEENIIEIENGTYANLANALPNGRTGISNKRIADPANLPIYLEDGDTATKLVNAVEIDWNGAQLSLPEELNWGITINILLAECIWSLETILNEKVHLTSGCTFAAKKGQHLF